MASYVYVTARAHVRDKLVVSQLRDNRPLLVAVVRQSGVPLCSSKAERGPTRTPPHLRDSTTRSPATVSGVALRRNLNEAHDFCPLPSRKEKPPNTETTYNSHQRTAAS